MKKPLLIALVCLNLALVSAVVFHARPAPAQAQLRRGAADYVTAAVRRGSSEEVLFIIDATQRLMIGVRADTSRGGLQLTELFPRDLERDFPLDRRR